MGKPRVIILGWINEGNTPQCGETVKNQHIIARLRALGVEVITLDFYRWRRRPWVLLKTAAVLALYPRTPLILSTAPKNVYRLMKAHKWLRSRRRIIHWVIGGSLHELIADGTIDKRYVQGLHINLVESSMMCDSMRAQGIDNVRVLPNFKPITYLPPLPPPRRRDEPVRFVFLSRIMPDKGVDYIFEAVRSLNAQGYADRFTVDFFGRIADDYADTFRAGVDALPNVSYGGFLDVNSPEGYDRLASYDMMLFPTYWRSEGQAGIFIDAFVCGLPLIATDWAHNRAFLTEGSTAIFIPVHSWQAIADAMKRTIDGDVDLPAMRAAARARAMDYDVERLLTPDLLREIGILPE